MPFGKPVEYLDRLTRAVIEENKLGPSMKEVNLSEEDLLNEIRKNAKVLWNAAATQISDFDDDDRKLFQIWADIIKLHPAPPEIFTPYLSQERQISIKWRALLFLLLLVSLHVIIGFLDGWVSLRDNFLTTAALKWLGIVSVPNVALLILYYWLEVKERKHRRKREQEVETIRAEWVSKIKAEKKKRGFNELDVRFYETRWEIDKKISPEIRKEILKLINDRINPSYELVLPKLKAPGLSEVFHSDYVIDTPAKNKLQFLLENMPGGSIGIAGPRGAGKSTLLLSFCGPGSSIKEIRGQKVLSVMTSAPVEYTPRDYILYLFSAVCQRILELQGKDWRQVRSDILNSKNNESSVINFWLKLLAPLTRRLLRIGTILIYASLLFAVLLALPERTVNEPRISADPSGTVAADQPSSSDDAVVSRGTSSYFPVNFIKAFEVKPGALLTWGLLLVVCGYSIRALLPGSLGTTDKSGKKSPAERPPVKSTKENSTPLAQEAISWLQDIKFQQGFTSGWSGGLKIPLGLEGGVNSAITLAQNQMSLPEIGHSFIRFLRNVSADYKVIIGIDELDKIESDEKAQRFLNEIKSVFGVEGCFYLISVSENALSSFERRGLPIRDVFDSSFDNIIYVGFLNIQDAKNLIEQRVIGKPAPFLDLSYCLSGGLARDMIRTFRDLLELRQIYNEKSDLETLCQTVVRTDLQAKLRALVISIQNIKTGVGSFAERLFELDSAISGKESLPTFLQTAVNNSSYFTPPLVSQDNKTKQKVDPTAELLVSLHNELSAYLYYSLTILQFFNNSLDQTTLMEAEANGHLDYLAKARQVLAINPTIARSLIKSFRKLHQL
jgi:hypothetical protein